MSCGVRTKAALQYDVGYVTILLAVGGMQVHLHWSQPACMQTVAFLGDNV